MEAKCAGNRPVTHALGRQRMDGFILLLGFRLGLFFGGLTGAAWWRSRRRAPGRSRDNVLVQQ